MSNNQLGLIGLMLVLITSCNLGINVADHVVPWLIQAGYLP